MGSERRTRIGTVLLGVSFSGVIGRLAAKLGDLGPSRQEEAIVVHLDHCRQGFLITGRADMDGHRLRACDA